MGKVRVGTIYRWIPNLMDVVCPPVGFTRGLMSKGDFIKVVNLYGCPKANTMGQCYVNNMHGEFCGMVSTNSLERRKDSEFKKDWLK